MILKHTILSTEASVEAVNAYLFHARLACAVVQSPLNLWERGALQHARLLQLVLVVQQSIHELLHLEKKTSMLLQTCQANLYNIMCSSSSYLYDSDFTVVFLYGLIKTLHHILKFIRLLVYFGCFWQI